MRVTLWCALSTGLSLSLAGCDQATSTGRTNNEANTAKISDFGPGASTLTSGYGSSEWGLAGRKQTIELEGMLSYGDGEAALEGAMEATVQLSASGSKSGVSRDISGSGSVESDGVYFAALTTNIAINGGTTGLSAGFGGAGSVNVSLAQAVSDESCELYCEASDSESCYTACTEDAAWIVAADSLDSSELVRVDASTRSIEIDLEFDHLEDADGETVEE